MTDAPVTGVLLAGGQSRRMGGGDKGLLPLAGQAMLSHVIDRLAPQVGAIVINANGDPLRFQAFGLPVVADTIAGFVGPLAGVLAGMRWSLAHAPQGRWIVTAPAMHRCYPSISSPPCAPRSTARPVKLPWRAPTAHCTR